MPSSSFLVSMLYVFLLRFFIPLSTDTLFVVATTLHLHTFHSSTYLFFCQYIVNTPTMFFSTFHISLQCIQNFVGEIWRKRPLEWRRCRWDGEIEMALKDIIWDGMGWIHLAQNRDKQWALV